MGIAEARFEAGSGETTTNPTFPSAGVRLRAIQIALGLLWVVDGALQFQPYMFSSAFIGKTIATNAQGQPWIIHATIVTLVQVAMPYRVIFNAGFALLQVAIGLGLIVSTRTVRLALLLSFGWTLVVWWAGEGLGLLFTGTASPLTGAPGAVLLYALIGLLVWPASQASARRDLAGRVIWALLWMLLAGLMLLPSNSSPNATSDAFAAAAASIGTGPLAALDTALAGLTAGRGLLISAISAGIMTEVGYLVLVDWNRRVGLVAGAAIGAFLFLTFEFLGGILTGQGTDPNSGPLLVLFAALLWVRPWSSATTRSPLDLATSAPAPPPRTNPA